MDLRALARYLIGTHHGRGRPLPPVVPDLGADDGARIRLDWDDEVLEAPVAHGLESLAAGWADLFWDLNAQYGLWGLAYLEAVTRLADHRHSERETQGNGKA